MKKNLKKILHTIKKNKNRRKSFEKRMKSHKSPRTINCDNDLFLFLKLGFQ